MTAEAVHEARACQQVSGDWIARCSCGWQGPPRHGSRAALNDVDRHHGAAGDDR